MKQRHTSWVAVGFNKGVEEPTWFYAFRTSEKAIEFTKRAAAHINPELSSVEWLVYPCEYMEVEETLTSMEDSVRDWDEEK